jgi:uncharacterized protein YdhG (YjbR/CyaY superfamily)
MKTKPSATNTMDAYIAGFPKETQKLLEQFRAIIKKSARGAEEKMAYGIPTFALQGNLVHFAGYKSHIGFYPAPSGIVAFRNELSGYVTSKGAVQFPLDKPLPVSLITSIVKFRVKENLAREDSKKKDKTNDDSFATLAAPAKRALVNHGIKSVKQLAKFSEVEISKLHGMGPSSLPKLRSALKAAGLSFKK